MPCDVVVCVKQVPHPDYLSKIAVDATRGTVNREGIPAVIDPGDRHALEEALRVRERFGGRVIVLTMGPPQARRALEEALAMDADAAIHLCDRAFAGADTLATAQALACGIRKLEHFDLVLCGNATTDSGTGQVAVQLAEFLDLPGITDVEEITFEDEHSLLVRRTWERGYVKARAKLPAVIGVTTRINQPRLANILGIMAASQKEIREWCTDDVGADATCVGLSGSPTQVFQMSEFHATRQGEILKGSPEEVLTKVVDRLAKLEIL